jgi:hypothetical protein
MGRMVSGNTDILGLKNPLCSEVWALVDVYGNTDCRWGYKKK